MNNKPKLLIFKEHGYSGYELKSVNKYMKEINLYDEWCEWFRGSTGGLEEDNSGQSLYIIYKWDFDDFLAGKPNLD